MINFAVGIGVGIMIGVLPIALVSANGKDRRDDQS